MPLVAILDGERLESFHLDDEQWSQLRGSYRDHELRMTCGELAIPKTSSRGMRFFAHKPGSDRCALHVGRPETPEHLQSKALLAEAARELGWEATIEHVAPDRAWIADVLIERGR